MSKSFLAYTLPRPDPAQAAVVVTKPVAAWGLKLDAELAKQNQARHTVTVTSIERFAAAPQFAFGRPVTIFETDDDGSNRVNWFQGFVDNPGSVVADGIEFKEYTFHNLWWMLERATYRQNRTIIAPQAYYKPGGAVAQYVTAHDLLSPLAPGGVLQATTPELYLGYNALTGALMSTGDTIVNALQWANNVFNPTRRGNTLLAGDNAVDPKQDLCIIGRIDPAQEIPVNQVNNMSCAEVIREMLKPHPTASFLVDYSTTPPTVSVRLMAGQARKVLNLAASPSPALRLTPRYDLQPSAVAIWYKILQTVPAVFGGPAVPCITWGLDIWPAPQDPAALLQPDVVCAIIELQGTNLTTGHVHLNLLAVGANSANAATRAAWWETKKKELSAANVDSVAVALPTSVRDDAGNNVDIAAAYPWECEGGEHAASDNSFAVIKCTIRARAQWKVYSDATRKVLMRFEDKEITVRIRVTNATQNDYFPVTGGETGEPQPLGLARGLFEEWSVLQYEGSRDGLRSTAVETDDGLDQGDVVDTAGLAANYTGLLVQSATHQLGRRRKRLDFGVPAHLGVQDYIAHMCLYRWRYRWHVVAEAASGQPAGNGNVELGTDHPLENSDGGAATPALDSVIADAAPPAGF